MPEVWVQMIVGRNREPYSEAAITALLPQVDGFAIGITSLDGHGQENEDTIRRLIPPEKLRLVHVLMSPSEFDFAKGRNAPLALIPVGAYVIVVDMDDVHWPSFEQVIRKVIDFGYDIATVHFNHLAVYKDLLHSVRHREIIFEMTPETRFERGVHETLIHPRKSSMTVSAEDYTYCHYGYVRPDGEVAARWELYRSLGAEIHDYDVSQPDRALDDWPRVCRPFLGEHPPAVRELLKSYPAAPADLFPKGNGKPRVGLVLLTWDDEENLRGCLDSLALTQEPFELCVVDNGSVDGTLGLVEDFAARTGVPTEIMTAPADAEAIVRESLAVALNRGFGWFVGREDLDFIGWIHPDHTFIAPDWLTALVLGMDEHPEYAKLGASEAGNQFPDPRPGNSQCFLIRRTALEKVGLFCEQFKACGGGEDWEMNARLLREGLVMIWPTAVVRHKTMATRMRHDNVEAAKHNMDLYHKLVGQWEPVV